MIEISASLLAADYAHMAEEVQRAERAGSGTAELCLKFDEGIDDHDE